VVDFLAEDLRAVTTNEDMEKRPRLTNLARSQGSESVALVALGIPSIEPEGRAAPAQNLLEDFYNLYEIPVEHGEGDGALHLQHGPGLLRCGERADREPPYSPIKQEPDAGPAIQTPNLSWTCTRIG